MWMLQDLSSDLHTHSSVLSHILNTPTTPTPMRKRGNDSLGEPQHIPLAPSPADSHGTGEIIPTFTALLSARAQQFFKLLIPFILRLTSASQILAIIIFIASYCKSEVMFVSMSPQRATWQGRDLGTKQIKPGDKAGWAGTGPGDKAGWAEIKSGGQSRVGRGFWGGAATAPRAATSVTSQCHLPALQGHQQAGEQRWGWVRLSLVAFWRFPSASLLLTANEELCPSLAPPLCSLSVSTFIPLSSAHM